MGRLSFRTVTAQTWDDFAALFAARGCPSYCWCTAYRLTHATDLTPAAKREAMRRRVAAGVPVGVLAFDGDDPVGWCSVAPRETYARLARSRTMPQVDEGAWSLLCFFVKRSHRDRGMTRQLVDSAVRYARAQGAAVVEAYPFDTAGISSTHRGHSKVFAGAGFRREGRRWVRRLRGSP